MTPPSFEQTSLWQAAFVDPYPRVSSNEQAFFKHSYLEMRDRASALVTRISADMPTMTVHDVTHLDALWRTASLATGPNILLSPAEAFVFGGAVLLHDSAMSLAAYDGGLESLSKSLVWKDSVARQLLDAAGKDSKAELELSQIPMEIKEVATQDALRTLHAEQAEVLATKAWKLSNGDKAYLIDNPEMRQFYGPLIGRLAHSHWWPAEKLENAFGTKLGAMPQRTNSSIDSLMIAAILRIADVLHLDQLRAPMFLRALIQPEGYAALHWEFQEHMAAPQLVGEDVVFTAAYPFNKSQSDAWWLAYEALSYADRELRDTDGLLSTNGRPRLPARSVRAANSPEAMAKIVTTEGWRPIDTRLRVSDIPKIIETLGGAQLYGDDSSVALRELIQNSADAISARRVLQKRNKDWGTITVGLKEENGSHILTVEDCGVGMSEAVMVGPLIDFGSSLWRSQMGGSEFPGLLAAGMNPKGKFGIGFFSCFMLGDKVRVTSQRYDQGVGAARTLEFSAGLSSQPILAQTGADQVLLDHGTRVEITLRQPPTLPGGLLRRSEYISADSLEQIVRYLAPALDVTIQVRHGDKQVVAIAANDWLSIEPDQLVDRLNRRSWSPSKLRWKKMMRPVVSASGQILGRLCFQPGRTNAQGALVVSGIRSQSLHFLAGILCASVQTADRNSSIPNADSESLSNWASEQAKLGVELVDDEEVQAGIAELVLSFGGDIGALKIARYDGIWMNKDELTDFVKGSLELFVKVDGEVEHEEDDDVTSRQFSDDFAFSPEVLFVPLQSTNIVRESKSPGDWITPANPSHLAQLVIKTIQDAWPPTNFDHDNVSHKVGTVKWEDIEREVVVFRQFEDAQDLT